MDSNHSGKKMNDGPNPQKSLEIKKKSDFETEIAFPETSRVFPSNPAKTGTVPVSGFQKIVAVAGIPYPPPFPKRGWSAREIGSRHFSRVMS